MLNASPDTLDELNDLPIKSINGDDDLPARRGARARRLLRRRQNMVRVNGRRAVLTTIQKNGAASTLDIISRSRRCCRGSRPARRRAEDQAGRRSVDLRRAAVNGVVREGVIAAALTGLMILLFLGSWRQHPDHRALDPAGRPDLDPGLSALRRDHQPHDAGRAGAGGRHPGGRRHRDHREHQLASGAGQAVEEAILDGAQQIAFPRLSRLLCICIVFVPMFFLTGVARTCSCRWPRRWCSRCWRRIVLSRTLVPTLAKYLLRATCRTACASEGGRCRSRRESLARFQRRFERAFSRCARAIRRSAGVALAHRRVFMIGFLGLCAVSFALLPWLGRELLPFGGFRPDQAARPRADRHAAWRRRRGCATRSSARSGNEIPAAEIRQHRGQHRPAGQRHQHHLQQLGADRSRGCGYPDFAERRAPSHRQYVQALRERLPRMTSRA